MNKVMKSAVFCVLFLVLTMLITIQLRVTSTSESKTSKTRILDGLKDQIILLNDENTKLGKKLENSTKLLAEARSRASENDTTNTEKSDIIKKYDTYLGNTDIYGEGLVITYIPTNNQEMSAVAEDIRYIVNELKNVGVEAISINGQRLVNNSSIVDIKNKIQVNNEELKAPYKIEVIGDSTMINNGITRPGGIIDLLKLNGVKITIDLKDNIQINRYSEV